MQSSRTIWRSIIIAAGLTALILLIRDFNSRMADLRRLTADRERVGAQVTQLVATKQYLETQVALAQSEEAVRKYAYEQGDLQQPDDTVVILVPEEVKQASPTPVLPSVPPVVEKWQLWAALFFETKILAAHTP